MCSFKIFLKEENFNAEQITKADRDVCHAPCGWSKARATLRRLSSTVLCTVMFQGSIKAQQHEKIFSITLNFPSSVLM